MPYLLMKTGIAVFAALMLASFTQAEAMPRLVQSGYAALPVEQVGSYRRYNRRYYPQTYNYGSDYPQDYSYRRRSYDYYPPGYSDEIHELRRRFPSTNWPPSMRY